MSSIPISRPNAAARGWGCRSRRTSSKALAARSRSTARRARAPRFGSTFHIILLRPDAPTGRVGACTWDRGRQMTDIRGSILLVEEEEKILKALGRALRDAGHRVADTTSAREAQRLLAERPFDLLIVDNVMPELTGPTTLYLL